MILYHSVILLYHSVVLLYLLYDDSDSYYSAHCSQIASFTFLIISVKNILIISASIVVDKML